MTLRVTRDLPTRCACAVQASSTRRVSLVRDGLLSKGIVTYMDGWSNCMGIMPEEAITRQQALKVLTINAAYQMHNEKERGSIAVGKYADFVIADKDVMNEACPVTDIHTANVIGTFFEGKQVYGMK